MDRLYRELLERSAERAREYWSKPAPVLNEEQRIEREKSRREFAKFCRCRVADVVWHGPDNCWTFR